MRLAARADLYAERKCEACRNPVLGAAYRLDWGCDAPTGKPIQLGAHEPLILRCPHALARESPHLAAWARWAATAHSYKSDGNLGCILRGDVELSIGGEDALNTFAAAIGDRIAAASKGK